MPRTYYDALRGPVPCKFIAWAKSPAHSYTGCFNAVIRITADRPGYKRGDVLHVPAFTVVHLLRDQRCRTAELPARTEANTIEARF